MWSRSQVVWSLVQSPSPNPLPKGEGYQHKHPTALPAQLFGLTPMGGGYAPFYFEDGGFGPSAVEFVDDMYVIINFNVKLLGNGLRRLPSALPE